MNDAARQALLEVVGGHEDAHELFLYMTLCRPLELSTAALQAEHIVELLDVRTTTRGRLEQMRAAAQRQPSACPNSPEAGASRWGGLIG